jgi:hypothetical protein
MNTTAHDFVTVDMRGLKAALVMRARSDRVSVSVLVRGAVAKELGLAETGEHGYAAPIGSASSGSTVKLSIRLTPTEAAQLAAGARAAGLSRGAFLAGLIANVPVLAGGASRTDHLAALVASSAELSTLSRNLRHLTTLLSQGQVRPAQEYRRTLDNANDDIHRHLALASDVLADLRPSPVRVSKAGVRSDRSNGDSP